MGLPAEGMCKQSAPGPWLALEPPEPLLLICGGDLVNASFRESPTEGPSPPGSDGALKARPCSGLPLDGEGAALAAESAADCVWFWSDSMGLPLTRLFTVCPKVVLPAAL